MSSSEHIPSPAPQRVIPLFSGPPITSSSPDRPAVKGRAQSNRSHPVGVDLSVFDILNIFRRCWFLSRANLLANVISAQKAEDGNISWVEFSPPFHSHLVKCAVALVPHPIYVVKKVMFVYILELLNQEGHLAFFELQKGGRKANNAQKEKRCLARKRSRASKQERDREAAKAAQLPPRERECLTCGRKFKSRKTTKKHKCAKHSKVVHEKEGGASGSGSHLVPPAQLNKPAPPLTPLAPTAPPNSSAAPPTHILGSVEVQEEFVRAFKEARRNVNIVLVWTPVDHKLVSQTAARQLATEACRRIPPEGVERVQSAAYQKDRARQKVYQEWAAEWERRQGEIRGGSRAASFVDKTTLTKPPDGNNHPLWLAATDCEKDGRGKRTKKPLFSRRTTSTAFQVAVDHTFTGSYASRFRPTDPPESLRCPCREPLRTSAHALYHCQRYHFERRAFGVVRYNRTIPYHKLLSSQKKNTIHFLMFLQETRALSRPESGPDVLGYVRSVPMSISTATSHEAQRCAQYVASPVTVEPKQAHNRTREWQNADGRVHDEWEAEHTQSTGTLNNAKSTISGLRERDIVATEPVKHGGE
ncbi:hypothetical protein EDB84DRAFT_1442388 [Lactarius hengduanensis]|nr:hypothetical protein EDB84DRAFT_1442388 [Lactarius hengduanensis]